MYNFSDALMMMKEGMELTRETWKNKGISIMVQFPDDHSKMTKPYIFMKKGGEKFPLDISCESIFAEDWSAIRTNDNKEQLSRGDSFSGSACEPKQVAGQQLPKDCSLNN